MRRRTEDLDEVRGHDAVGARPAAPSRTRTRSPGIVNGTATVRRPSARDAVAREIERLDLDVDRVTVTG